MNVEYIELAVAQPAAYSGGAHRSEVHSGHRAVVTDWYGCTRAGELLDIKPSRSRAYFTRSEHKRSMSGLV
jgi:hypothetical protein